jgi:thiol-disulfide isomerase/thioredoxin
MTTLLIGIGSLIGLMAALQIAIRLRARLLQGKPIPQLPGSWSKKLAGRTGSILYFFSPGCAACRPLTPRFKEMSNRRPTSVYLVNVAEDLDLARALKVMATPSLIEVADGKIVGYHIGPPPPAVMARYA